MPLIIGTRRSLLKPPAVVASGSWQVAFTAALDSDSGGSYASESNRVVCPITVTGTKVRVTFQSRSDGIMIADHCSVGIQDSAQNTTATPVELLFSAGSGFTLAANGTLLSDERTLSVSNGQSLIVAIDYNASNNGIKYLLSGTTYNYAATAATYNNATPGAPSNTYGLTASVSQIEVFVP